MGERTKIISANLLVILIAYAYHSWMAAHFLQNLPFPAFWIFLFHLIVNFLLWASVAIVKTTHTDKTGFVFMVWGIIKIILSGIFLLWLQYRYQFQGNVWFVIDFMGLYVIFLFFELWAGIRLIQKIFD